MAEKRIKTIDELTLMDDYMFAQVMRDKRHLKPLLEYILKVRIAKIDFIEPQKTEKEGYTARGVRLDLYVTDEDGIIYNVEVQTSDKKNLPRRMRYYQSTIDISILKQGVDYKELKASYVIFICNYDEFGRGRYIYTFENTCREEPGLTFGDDAYKVVVNTKGCRGEVSEELMEAIRYLDDGSVTGEYSRELDDAVKAVKASEERRLEYMLLVTRDNEMRAEGREEGLKEGLKEGFKEGREETMISNIKNMMRNLGWSLQNVLDALGITDPEERTRLAGKIG